MTFSNNNLTIGGKPGQMMYDAIVAAAERGVRVRIAKVRCTARHCTALHCTALHCTARWAGVAAVSVA